MLCVHLYVYYSVIHSYWPIGCWEVSLRKGSGFGELSCKLCYAVHTIPLPSHPMWALGFGFPPEVWAVSHGDRPRNKCWSSVIVR